MASHLVTGAAGFLGRYLVRALLARGDAVRAFDRYSPHDADSRVDWWVGDIREADAVWRACQGIEVVHHLAALIPQRQADAETMQAVNVGGTRHVLDGAQAAGVRRVVYLSSVEIYGIPSIWPCPEDGPLAPSGEYGRNKLAAEALCRQAIEGGLAVTMLRPVTIIGPGLSEPFLVSLLAAVHTGQPVLLLGQGQNRFQFVHAEDVVAACLLAAEHPAAVGQPFNIGTADVPSIRHMVEEVIARAGSASRVRSIPVPVARLAMGVLRLFGKAPLDPERLAIAIADYVFDITKARQVLGWEPQWGNVDALMDTYADLYRPGPI